MTGMYCTDFRSIRIVFFFFFEFIKPKWNEWVYSLFWQKQFLSAYPRAKSSFIHENLIMKKPLMQLVEFY